MVKQRFSIGLVLLTATFAAANCNSGDTVVSVNVSYDSTAMDVQKAVSSLQIVVKPKSGGGSPVTTTVPIMRDDAGVITTPVYRRITINGWTGPTEVTVDARDGDKVLLSASTTVQVEEHEAVAAFVRFAVVMPDAGAPADAGADAVDAGSGGTTGSGGSDGSGGASGAGGTVSGSGGA